MKYAARTGAIVVGALSAVLVCQPARADYYAFANSQDFGASADYGCATLSLLVGKTWIDINTGGFQGWISTNSYNIGGPAGVNSNYIAGAYDNTSYNDYFGFYLSDLHATAPITAAKLIVYSGLINERVNYSLFGATQWISQLETGPSPNTALYHALATGPEYDLSILSANTTNPMAQLTFMLNGLALTDINRAIQNRTMMFAISGHADPAPEPSTWVLMLIGLAAVGYVGYRPARVGQALLADKPAIDSQRMTLRVGQDNGQRDRYVMLSPQLLELLRDWWRAARPQVWLFPGQNPVNPMTARQLNRAVHVAKTLAYISKRISPRTLRHHFATRLLEQNVDIRLIQVLLGHAKLETTALYTRVAGNTIRDIKSPLERLGVNLASRSPPA